MHNYIYVRIVFVFAAIIAALLLLVEFEMNAKDRTLLILSSIGGTALLFHYFYDVWTRRNDRK